MGITFSSLSDFSISLLVSCSATVEDTLTTSRNAAKNQIVPAEMKIKQCRYLLGWTKNSPYHRDPCFPPEFRRLTKYLFSSLQPICCATLKVLSVWQLKTLRIVKSFLNILHSYKFKSPTFCTKMP